MLDKTSLKFLGVAFLLVISACKEKVKQHDLGAISPERALLYMETSKNLVIIDTAFKPIYDKEHFVGAINIPYNEMSVRYNEVPKNVPVILHCRHGRVAPIAYEELKRTRPDIPEISYINGVPPFKEYNAFKASAN